MNMTRTISKASKVPSILILALVCLMSFAPGLVRPATGETVQYPLRAKDNYAGAPPQTINQRSPNAPSVLSVEAQKYAWHTFYGAVDSGSYADEPYVIATDHAGNIYFAGYSYADWLGDGGTQPLHPFSGSYSMVVVKLNNQGIYQWHTFYPSGGMLLAGEGFIGMAVDENGNLYLSGYSDSAWLGDGDAEPLHPFNALYDIAVVKLNANGVYQWHTFYGSGGNEVGSGIVVDNSGYLYLTGVAASSWLGPGGESPRHAYSGGETFLVLKLNSSGAYQWHTFYGPSDIAYGYDIVVDGSGNTFTTGMSRSTWQGDNNTNPIHAHSGGQRDVFVLKLDANGTYQWHTFYPTTGYYKRGITTDRNNNVYFVDNSASTWQGDGNANPLHPHSGGQDIVAIKLNSIGVYQWHTFYGSSANDYSDCIISDDNGGLYICGVSVSSWHGDGGADPLHAFSGSDADIVLLKLDQAGSYQWHTFEGGPAGGADIAVSEDEDLYVLGASTDNWPGEGGAQPLHPHTQNWADDFVVLKMVKIDIQALLPFIQK
jgi:hypothetical protein